MNLMLFVSYIFFVMCRQIPPCGENILIGDGDAELGLVVLKARNWSFFFLKIGSQDSICWVKGCVCPRGRKRDFQGKNMFHLSTFQVMMLVVTIEGGTGP